METSSPELPKDGEGRATCRAPGIGRLVERLCVPTPSQSTERAHCEVLLITTSQMLLTTTPTLLSLLVRGLKPLPTTSAQALTSPTTTRSEVPSPCSLLPPSTLRHSRTRCPHDVTRCLTRKLPRLPKPTPPKHAAPRASADPIPPTAAGKRPALPRSPAPSPSA